MEGPQQVTERVGGNRMVGSRRGDRGQGVWDVLINRVSDSTHFCPWDESSRAHRLSGASGNSG